MHNEGKYYQYVTLYCDDLIIEHKDPYHLFESIRGKYFIIKDTLSPEYFLGGDFEPFKEPNTENQIPTWGSKTYVKRMMYNFKNTFRFGPSKQDAVIPLDYMPQIDTNDLFNYSDKAQ